MQAAYRKDARLMLRTLRMLAAISFVWMVGFFLLRVTIIASGVRFMVPFATFSLLSTLCGELGFAVGILALVATVSRRQIAWCVLFALLLALLHVLPLLIFRPSPSYPDFLALFEAPPVIFGRYIWVVLLPALIPGLAFIYARMVQEVRRVAPEFADVTRAPLRP
jgi:hypothetical protein